MKRKTSPHQAALTDRTTIKVRFSEIDSMQIVWHGEYVVSKSIRPENFQADR